MLLVLLVHGHLKFMNCRQQKRAVKWGKVSYKVMSIVTLCLQLTLCILNGNLQTPFY